MRSMIKWVAAGVLLLISALPAKSQLVSFGVKVGVPLTDPLSTGRGGSGSISHEVRHYLVGATGEVHFPHRFSVEVDALYRSLNYTVFPNNLPATRFTPGDWQFPLLAKYEFRQGVIVHPFVDAGATFRHVSLSNVSLANPNSAGVSVGGGVTLKLLFLRLSPEIRYTNFSANVFGSNFNFIRSTSNQVDFLVGLTF